MKKPVAAALDMTERGIINKSNMCHAQALENEQCGVAGGRYDFTASRRFH